VPPTSRIADTAHERLVDDRRDLQLDLLPVPSPHPARNMPLPPAEIGSRPRRRHFRAGAALLDLVREAGRDAGRVCPSHDESLYLASMSLSTSHCRDGRDDPGGLPLGERGGAEQGDPRGWRYRPQRGW
jgi:hypothetical protein